jgi:hypothetical protein
MAPVVTMAIPLRLVAIEIIVLEVADPTENSAEILVMPVVPAILNSQVNNMYPNEYIVFIYEGLCSV